MSRLRFAILAHDRGLEMVVDRLLRPLRPIGRDEVMQDQGGRAGLVRDPAGLRDRGVGTHVVVAHRPVAGDLASL